MQFNHIKYLYKYLPSYVIIMYVYKYLRRSTKPNAKIMGNVQIHAASVGMMMICLCRSLPRFHYIDHRAGKDNDRTTERA